MNPSKNPQQNYDTDIISSEDGLTPANAVGFCPSGWTYDEDDMHFIDARDFSWNASDEALKCFR